MSPPPPDDPELRYTDRSSHYTNVALAGINDADHADWLPENGWSANRGRVLDVYAYYAGLAAQQPDTFLWAGLGRMAGGAVVSGMDADPGFVDQPLMVSIGRDIFFDLAWQHEAFLDAPDTIVELATLHDSFGRFPTTPAMSYGDAWKQIVSGDPDQVAAGNRALLQNEQWTIVQPRYDVLKQEAGSELPTPFTRAVHPYHQDFIIELPGQDILDRDPRWEWITREAGMWEKWVACGADERGRLLGLPFDQILRGDFGPAGRPDLLPPGV